LNAKATPNLEFAPPKPPGAGRAWVVAGIAHAVLFMALGLATAWKTQPQTAQAEAELWSAVPQAAAPKLQEPPPEPEPEPAPTPQPVKPTPPPHPAPDPAQERLDAQIALEKKKQEEKKKNDKLKADKEKAEKDRKSVV
jgi:colicin import membrane protein